MKVLVFNNCNLNAINQKQWNSFCEHLAPYLKAYSKLPAEEAVIVVSKDGECVEIRFHLREVESLQIVTAKFDKFMCKEWVFDNYDKKIKNIPPYNVILSWQLFLTKVFGKDYEIELDSFYKKENINNTLIKTLIKNSINEFKF